MNGAMTLLNSRQIALLQSRLDHHEVELHELHRRIDVQKTLISKLLQMILGMRNQSRAAEQLADKMLRLLRILGLQMNLVKMQLMGGGAAAREGLLKDAAHRLWQLKGRLGRVLATAFVCHLLLRVSQVYVVPETILALLVGGFVSPGMRRRIQQTGNISLLLLATWLWRDLAGNLNISLGALF